MSEPSDGPCHKLPVSGRHLAGSWIQDLTPVMFASEPHLAQSCGFDLTAAVVCLCAYGYCKLGRRGCQPSRLVFDPELIGAAALEFDSNDFIMHEIGSNWPPSRWLKVAKCFLDLGPDQRGSNT